MNAPWLRNRWVAVLIGLLGGAAAGFAVYASAQLKGRELFILCGATAGVAAASIMQRVSRTVRLTEITVTVPQFSKLRFAVTRDNQLVAWRLYVDVSTRISTQRLDEGTGLIREALNSLYTLFGNARETLKQSEPSRGLSSAPTVEHLAIAMLNLELRPFLSRWHPRLKAWETAHPLDGEVSWPENAECRAELAVLQARLRTYVLGFGKLASVPNAEEILDGVQRPGKVPQQAGL